ncbi:WIYLD domain [Dillenia turbinata]|uniref:WIYLD domain n=1 Tax=Dillenia turbinata TaxID=194707 RepID=A0AAN8ZCE1_9MAGN
MAPRGRTRKVGLSRMDAAIDAMKEMGFAAPLVRKKVKDLLKVYDGDGGWPFIEEFSYKLLIETILAPEENEVEPKLQTKLEESYYPYHVELNRVRVQCSEFVFFCTGSFCLIASLLSHKTGSVSVCLESHDRNDVTYRKVHVRLRFVAYVLLAIFYVDSPQNEAADGDHGEPSLMAERSPALELPDPNEELTAVDPEMVLDPAPPAKGNLLGWKDILPHQNSNEALTEDGCLGTLCSSSQKDDDQEEKISSPEVSPNVSSFTTMRRPSYGWIGAVTDESDFLILPPAPLGGAQGRNNHKRKLKWDVFPKAA